MDLLEQLILLVEQNPELYDVRNENYKNRIRRENIWFEISQEINLSPEECQAKWRSLRTTFVRKCTDSEKSGSGSSKEIIWPYYNMMNFIRPYIHQNRNRTTCNFIRLESEKTETDVQTTENSFLDDSSEGLQPDLPEADLNDVEHGSHSIRYIQPIAPKKRKVDREKTRDPVEEAICSLIKNDDIKDDIFYHMRGFECRIRQMNKSAQRAVIKEFFQILDKFELE